MRCHPDAQRKDLRLLLRWLLSIHAIQRTLTFAESIARRGRRPVGGANDEAIQEANALAAATETDNMNHDIKPDSIMFLIEGYA